MKHYFKVMAIAMAWVLLLPASARLAAQEALVLTSAPRESVQEGQALYEPLARRLEEVLGRPVVYRHPGNWLAYQRDLKNDAYDIILDGPHLVSWRMQEFGHAPLVKLPGSLEFVLLVNAGQGEAAVTGLEGLVARRICSVAPPNLAPLVVLAQYPDVVRQPLIHPARRGMSQALEQFRAGQCDAVALPTNFYNNSLSDADRQGLRVLFRSAPLPNQAISVSRRVTEQERVSLVELFTTPGEPTVRSVLQVFARNAERFVPVTGDEYEPHYMLLRGVVFGW